MTTTSLQSPNGHRDASLKAGESETPAGTASLLELKDLAVKFKIDKDNTLHAVDRVSFVVNRNEVVGIVGESGSGKSLTALSILKLTPRKASVTGRVTYYLQTANSDDGQVSSSVLLSDLSESKLKRYRGSEIAMIFQDPLSSLNPVQRVGDQIVEAIRLHRRVDKKEAWAEAIHLMRQVGIQSPESRAHDFPHQLSGGMRQRVMIAMALSMEPKLLIADEPTTLLDEISQMQIIDMLKQLRNRLASILYITHDLGVVAELCTKVVVMYSGRVMEVGDVTSIFQKARHPYTKLLIESIPRVDKAKSKRMPTIPGNVTPAVNPKAQCRFVDRCPYAIEKCKESLPELEPTEDGAGHLTACIRWRDLAMS
jgi:oligopeptide/dipeptide ABC transporter ATP-binding protein